MKFKVCGLFNDKNIHQVAKLNPDYIGHIFWENSLRYVNGPTPVLSKKINKTGVFFNSSIEDIYDKIDEHNLNCVQLHGDESPEFCKEIMDKGIRVIKSFRIDDNFDFIVLKKYNLKKEFFISGGIGIHSLKSLIDLFKMKLPIYGIDVNSKFEDKNHLKKINELETFIQTVKNEIYSR